jgi:hypothetical protein
MHDRLKRRRSPAQEDHALPARDGTDALVGRQSGDLEPQPWSGPRDGGHLESVLPQVAHRQWTLRLPFSLRLRVVRQPQLLKRLEVRLVQAVWRWQRRKARRHGAQGELRGGGVFF